MADLATVIVLSYNGRQFLGTCLSSILSSTHDPIDLLLVDNASDDGSAAWVKREFPDVKVIVNDRNLGFAGGMNKGISNARGRFVAFLNQDATVDKHWLSNLVRLLEDPGIGICGSKIYYPDGKTLQHAGGIIRYPQALADHFGYRQQDQGQWNEAKDMDYVTGAAFATRRDVLDSIGDFDEGFYPAYFEDTDLCFRARAAGYRVVYVPEAVAIHHESATTVRDSYGYFVTYHMARMRFILKHYTTSQILQDFYTAEAAWLSGVQSRDERRALGQAYRTAREWETSLTSVTPSVSKLLRTLSLQAGSGFTKEKLGAGTGLRGRLKEMLGR